MKSLIEISKIVTKKKVRKIEIFDDQVLRQKSSKFNEFYESLTAGKFKNDRDAAMQLYKCSPQDAKYRQLKSRFKKRLLNTLFFLDINKPSASNYDRAYFSCNKDWTLVKILLANGANQSAASLAKSILTVALKFQFADVIVNCSRILREFYAAQSDEKEYEIYDTYIKQYADILNAEIRSEELYQRVIMQYYKPLNKTGDLLLRIDTYCNALVGLSETFQSPAIYYNMFLVWIMRYEMLRDYDAMLEVCKRAEEYSERNPHFYQEEKQIVFHTKKMSAYLHLRDYRQGRINAEKCLNTFPEGSEVWFSFMEYYLLLALHTDNYIQAAAILKQTITHAEFKKLEGTEKDKWAIFEAYVNFLVEKLGVDKKLVGGTRYRLSRTTRYMEEPRLYPKDQRTFTIHIWILKVLHLMDRRQFGELNEEIEQLKYFANRQLNREEHVRPIQFIRLLQQLRKAGYIPDEMTNAEKYNLRLQSHPLSYRGALSELEIIPYEKLWQIILRNFHDGLSLEPIGPS